MSRRIFGLDLKRVAAAPLVLVARARAFPIGGRGVGPVSAWSGFRIGGILRRELRAPNGPGATDRSWSRRRWGTVPTHALFPMIHARVLFRQHEGSIPGLRPSLGLARSRIAPGGTPRRASWSSALEARFDRPFPPDSLGFSTAPLRRPATLAAAAGRDGGGSDGRPALAVGRLPSRAVAHSLPPLT